MAHLVLDVESIGLYGEGFAVGWVVVDDLGLELGQGYAACLPDRAEGSADDHAWVETQVAPNLPLPTRESPSQVRLAFWGVVERMRDRFETLSLWADCAYPVETRFMEACVNEFGSKFDGPYPLHEVGTALLLDGLDPVGIYDRLEAECPKHHPTRDARQSARLMIEALRRIRLARSRAVSIRLFPDGSYWLALIGEDLQAGVSGFGLDPFFALQDLHKQISGGALLPEGAADLTDRFLRGMEQAI